MSKHKLIVLSNRLPVTVSKKDGKLHFEPSSGGLATAMSSIEGGDSTIWLGWPGIASDDLSASEKREITAKLNEYSCYPVFLTAKQIENFYEGYSNETLWPLFHYFQSIAQFNDIHWDSYKEVNKLFADAAAKLGSKNSTIWVHDYHLMLCPKMIRKNIPDATIGFFLHIPFPSFEVFRLLPHRKELLLGLMGADLVGFHIYDYVRHFVSSVLRTLGYESDQGSIYYGKRVVKADAFPIGIDYIKFAEALEKPAVKREMKLLDNLFNGKKVILSVDRLDYSKGIANRLEAFENFLNQYPQYHKKVTLVMVAVPSRTEVDAYKELRDGIEQTVSRINGKYATVDWTPVSYQFKNQEFDKLVALYAKADIALVTPVRDGMNLVAKEYIASKQRTNGVLILSELTGAADELPEALIINPNDTASVVRALDDAVKMEESSQRERLAAMQRRISNYDVTRWAEDFLDQLNQTRKVQILHSSKMLTKRHLDKLAEVYKSASRRLLILDYDGTLRSFVPSARSGQAAPSRQLLQTLSELSAHTKNEVWIVSGRTRQALEEWFENLPVNLIAEHGYWSRINGKWKNRIINTEKLKNKVLPTMIKYTERTPGAVLEDKHSSLVWHYRNVNPELAYVRKQNLKHDLSEVLRDMEADVHSGNKILEVKPSGINKGSAVTENVNVKSCDFILCIGDDYTDEDMFRVFENVDHAFTIKVGLGASLAKYQVLNTDEVSELLDQVNRS